MRTDDLIRAISADAGRRPMPLDRLWLAAGLTAALLGAAVFMTTLGPRPDALASLAQPRFVAKFAVTLTLAGTAFHVLRTLARPGGDLRQLLPWLLLAPALLAAAVTLELATVPEADWPARLIGTNSRLCLTFVPLIGAGPLAIFLLALREGATTHPVIAGAAAGLLAGGLAATFYASHCPDDSPLFVATWYSLAILALTATGAVLAPRLARW